MADTPNRVRITVGSQNAGTTPGSAQKSKILVAGKPVETSQASALDLVFVIDSTGSMSDKIGALKSMCERFVDDLAKSSISHRVAIVAFGDLTVTGDRISKTPFTTDVRTIKTLLQKLPTNSGGGNAGESSLEAIQAAQRFPFQQKCIKALVLMTDEPALQHNVTWKSIQQSLVADGFLLFAFATSDEYYKSFARATGGSWWDIDSARSLDSVLSALTKLAASVTKTVTNVAKLAGGDVKKYLQLGK